MAITHFKTNGPDNTTTTSKESFESIFNAEYYRNVAIIVAMIFAFFTVILTITLIVLKIVHKHKAKIINLSLAATCDRSDENMNYEKLRLQCKKFLETPNYADRIIADNIGIREEDAQLEKCRETVKIRTCRYPELHCLIKSQVQVMSVPKYILHMNRMFDFNNDYVYLSQAPLKEEFPLFANSIVDEGIGVVVWLGNLLSENTFVPYLPINRKSSLQLGNFVAHNVENIYSKNGYDKFEIRLARKKKSQKIEEEIGHTIFVFNIDFWPDYHNEQQLIKLARVLKLIQSTQKTQKATNNLPGVLFHCFDGVDQSAAFCASYLAYQVYRRRRKANINGILRYIRKHRHRAFTFSNEPSLTVPVIFCTLEVLASFDNVL